MILFSAKKNTRILYIVYEHIFYFSPSMMLVTENILLSQAVQRKRAWNLAFKPAFKQNKVSLGVVRRKAQISHFFYACPGLVGA